MRDSRETARNSCEIREATSVTVVRQCETAAKQRETCAKLAKHPARHPRNSRETARNSRKTAANLMRNRVANSLHLDGVLPTWRPAPGAGRAEVGAGAQPIS